MNTVSYTERKNYVKYDNEHYLLYLNEATAEITSDESDETTEGYAYSGTEADGGTMIEAADVTDDNRRAKFIAGLIDVEYDMDAQVAILANGDDTAEHAAELEEFAAYRASCKTAIDELLEREV